MVSGGGMVMGGGGEGVVRSYDKVWVDVILFVFFF